jgi:NAD-dependent SIR2 family protein deacetylase
MPMSKPTSARTNRWVPDRESDLESLTDVADLLQHLEVTVLTGAGCSTESGIPDYRGPKREDSHPEPITYREFVRTESTRRRYWARAMLGWPRFDAAEPNDAHRALARLEDEGCTTGVITQNVDRLHQRAGSDRVVELHGALADVRCLDCGRIVPRHSLQQRLRKRNPGWADQNASLAPDGDAELPTDIPEDFRVPACRDCGGILKPDVVFFGENVPDETVDRAWKLWRRGEALLVVGSSLQVWSGYRFVRHAAETMKPVVIVNLGATRGDDEAWLRVEARAGEAMTALADRLCEP